MPSSCFTFHLGLMLIKFFISLRKNWFGSEGFLVACMKIAFFAIFDPTCGPTVWSKKGPGMEFSKQNFNFKSLRKTETILLLSM